MLAFKLRIYFKGKNRMNNEALNVPLPTVKESKPYYSLTLQFHGKTAKQRVSKLQGINLEATLPIKESKEPYTPSDEIIELTIRKAISAHVKHLNSPRVRIILTYSFDRTYTSNGHLSELKMSEPFNPLSHDMIFQLDTIN
jgi:hypothetical protein